jgi:hypothetical protein
MAVQTATSTQSGQGIIRIFKLSTVSTGDTFVGPASPKAYWVENTSTSSAVTATESSGTYTFTIASGTPNLTLFVLL